MDSFKYVGIAELKHLNVRKEGEEDDRELAVDLKFEGTTDALPLCTFFDFGLHAFLFNEIGAVKNLSLEPICFANKIKQCTLTTLGVVFQRVTLKKFSIAPIDGNRIILTFSASFFPNQDEIAKLADSVLEEIRIVVEQESLFDQDSRTGS